jgi:hypothetical protein
VVRVFGYIGVVVFGAMGVLAGACSNVELVGPGGACYQTIDCQLGFACVPLPNDGGGMCTNDLSKIVMVPEAGSDMAVPDVTPMDSPTDQVVQDVVTMDTGTQDTGTQDTGTTDAGAG